MSRREAKGRRRRVRNIGFRHLPPKLTGQRLSEDSTAEEPGKLPDNGPDPDLVDRRHLDMRVFGQAEVWVHPTGEVRTVDGLSAAEADDLVVYLRSNAEHFFAEELRRLVLARLVADLDEGRLPVRDQEQAPVLRQMLQTSPEEWLEATPLLKGLTQRAASAR